MPWWRKKSNLRKAIIFILAVISIYGLFLVRDVIISFLLALTIFYLFNPVIDRLENKGTKRTWSIILVYLAILIIVLAAGLYGIPRMIKQLNSLLEEVPVYALNVELISDNIQSRYSSIGLPNEIKDIVDSRIQWLEDKVLELVNRVIFSIIAVFEHIFSFLLAPVIAFYMLRDFGRFKEDIFTMAPRKWQNDLVILLGDINQVLNSYVRGYLLVSVIVALLTSFGMFIIGMDFPLVLGLFAGLTELIPYFGPFIGALPAVLLALLKSKWLALKVVAVFLVVQQLEGNVFSPKILGDQVGLHPIAVIVALLVAGELFGLPGMLLAVPITAILKILISFILHKT